MNEPFVMADGLSRVAAGHGFITVTTATERFFRHPGVAFRPMSWAPPTENVIVTVPGAAAASTLVTSLLALAAEVTASLIDLVPGATAVVRRQGTLAAPSGMTVRHLPSAHEVVRRGDRPHGASTDDDRPDQRVSPAAWPV